MNITYFKEKFKIISENNSAIEICMTAVLGMLMLIQRFLAGAYKPVMDDWFLYGDLYRKLLGRLKYFALPNEKFAIRPAAGFIDCFITAPLFEHLWIIELTLTLSLLIGAFFIIKTLRRNNAAGTGFFMCLVCLFPVGLEATYWIAASTRICYAVLFSGTAVYSLNFYLETKNKRALILYTILGMISVCFYEPAIVIYILLALFVMWCHRDKTSIIPLIILAAHIAAIGIYYILNAASGEIESRGGLLQTDILEHTKLVFQYTKDIFTKLSYDLTKHGFENGLAIIFGGHKITKTAIITILSLVFGLFSAMCIKKRRFSWQIFVFGIILFLGGISLNFVLGSDRIPLRLVYFSYLGIGIIIDGLLTLLPHKVGKVITFAILACAAFVFTVSGIGEVQDYRKVSEFDTYITRQLIELDTENNLTNVDKNTYVFGGQHAYEETRCIHYLDHIRGASGSYADFTGCMQHLTGKAFTNNIIPFTYADIQILKPYIDEDSVCSFYNIEYDKTVTRAKIVPDGENYSVLRDDGTYIGTLTKVDDTRYQFFD